MDENAAQVPKADDSVAMLMIGGGRQLQRHLEDKLAAIGMTFRHFGALGHLARDAELSYSDLARRAGVTTQSMRATVLMLEEQGAVRRTLPGHGHAAKLELTESGRRMLDRARGMIGELDEELLAPLDAADRQDLASVLRRLLTSLAQG